MGAGRDEREKEIGLGEGDEDDDGWGGGRKKFDQTHLNFLDNDVLLFIRPPGRINLCPLILTLYCLKQY